MSSFFTRSGDEGYTGLLGEGRVAKDDAVLEALGTLDEANASLGLARALSQAEGTAGLIVKIQRDLYAIMAEIAAVPQNADRFRTIEIKQVLWLEDNFETFLQKAPAPRDFIVPGDTLAGAALDVARTVIRRAERRITQLQHRGWVRNPDLLRYLNRLSSLIFVLELYENQAAGHSKPTLAKTED